MCTLQFSAFHLPASAIFEKEVQGNESKSLLQAEIRHDDLCLCMVSSHEDLSFVISLLSAYFSDVRPRKSKEVWLVGIAGTPVSDTDIAARFSDLALDLDDDVYVYVDSDDSTTVKIFEVYKISDDSGATVLPFGRWSKDKNLLETQSGAKYERRRDLKARLYLTRNTFYKRHCKF